jgi:hypothetical protein
MKNCVGVLLMALSLQGFAWGETGHRVIGLIAEKHLTPKAKQNIQKLLGRETLAQVSTYMDFIRSEPANKHMDPWHFMTVSDGVKYEASMAPPEGDIYVTIQRLILELKSKKFSDGDELFALKCLVHLIGDIHQPLHVGKPGDRGGNAIDVEFYWQKENLHRVWDSGIIDKQLYSFTEYVEWINHTTPEKVAKWQKSTIDDWVAESMSYREVIYNLPENKKINYRYVYDTIEIVNLRLLQAGVRLAGVLNQIYG